MEFQRIGIFQKFGMKKWLKTSKFNGSIFARCQGIDLETDLFDDNFSETRVEIEE